MYGLERRFRIFSIYSWFDVPELVRFCGPFGTPLKLSDSYGGFLKFIEAQGWLEPLLDCKEQLEMWGSLKIRDLQMIFPAINLHLQCTVIFHWDVWFPEGTPQFAMFNRRMMATGINQWLVGGLEHFIFSHILVRIIPTDELIFFRGVGIPPTRWI